MTDVSVELVKELGLQPAYMYAALKTIKAESILDEHGMFPASVSYVDSRFGFNEYFQRKSLRILKKDGMVEVKVKGSGCHATRYFRLIEKTTPNPTKPTKKRTKKQTKQTKKIVVEPSVEEMLKTLTPVEHAAYHSCRGHKQKSLLLKQMYERKLEPSKVVVPQGSNTETSYQCVLYIPNSNVIISTSNTVEDTLRTNIDTSSKKDTTPMGIQQTATRSLESRVFDEIASDYIADEFSGNYDKKRESNIRQRCGLYIRKLLKEAKDDVSVVVKAVKKHSNNFSYGKQVDFWLNDNIGVLMDIVRYDVQVYPLWSKF